MFYKETEYKDTPIGKTPKQWELKRMRDVCKVVTGGTPSTKHPEYFGGNIKWLKSGDIKQLHIYDTTEKLTQLGIENSNAKTYPSGSVAIALSGRGQTRGKTTITKAPMACSQSVAFMIPNSGLLAEYLHYNLANRYMEIRNLTGHLDRSGLNLSIVSDILIPIPSLEEQRVVVGVLGVVDSAIELVDRVIWKTERLKKGLMQKLLTEGIGHKEFKDTEIGKIPRQWVVTKIGEHLELLTGFPFKSNLFSKDKSGIRLVRGINVTSGRLRWNRPQYWNKSTEGLEKYLLAEKDVLIGMDGALVGRNYAIVKKEELPLLLVQRVARLRTKAGIHPEFLYYSIGSNSFRRYVDSVNTSSGIAHISGKQIEDFQIPLPSFEEQLRIVEILSTVSTKLQLEIKEKSKLERIKKGLMDLLLSGKVRVKVD